MLHYVKICRLQILHEYYVSRDHRCPDLELIPTAETRRFMQQAGIVCKAFDSGLIILAPCETKEGEAYAQGLLADSFALHFELRLRNASFYNITDLRGLPAVDQALYFDNLGKLSRAEDVKMLHAAPYAEDEDRLSFAMPALSAEAARQQSVDLMDAAGQAYKIPVSAFRTFYRGLPDGKYSLKNKKAEDSFFKLSGQMRSVTGIVSLWNHPKVEPSCRMVQDDGRLAAQEYAIRFRPAETFWKYYLPLKLKDFHKYLELREVNKGVQFVQQEEPEDWLVFRSEDSLPMTDSPGWKVQLIALPLDENDLEQLLWENLPQPSASALNKQEDGRLCSDIFVQL